MLLAFLTAMRWCLRGLSCSCLERGVQLQSNNSGSRQGRSKLYLLQITGETYLSFIELQRQSDSNWGKLIILSFNMFYYQSYGIEPLRSPVTSVNLLAACRAWPSTVGMRTNTQDTFAVCPLICVRHTAHVWMEFSRERIHAKWNARVTFGDRSLRVFVASKISPLIF